MSEEEWRTRRLVQIAEGPDELAALLAVEEIRGRATTHLAPSDWRHDATATMH